MANVLLNFVSCVAVCEVFAIAAGYSHLKAGEVPNVCLLAAAAVLVQAVVFIHASGVVFGNERTERFFDLTGSLTFLSLTVLSAHLRGGVEMLSLRQRYLCMCVIVWASRLGCFLFARINRHGGVDNRFTAIKPDLNRFSRFWGIQGIWVFLTALPVFMVVSSPDEGPTTLVGRDFVGLGVWLVGFLVEVVADWQKACWVDKSRFINTGLWALSRHPNYFGEICLWIGVSICASSSFVHLCNWACLVSPAIVALLLIKVSGIPLLEKMADKKFQDDPQYKEYKARVPVLVPWVGRTGDAPF